MSTNYTYIMKSISPTYTSNSIMTPGCEPRPTQSNIAEIASVVCDADGVPISSNVIEPVTDQYLCTQSYDRKGFWVDRPTKNAHYIQNLSKLFETIIQVTPPKMLFPAPYYSDLEYIKFNRLLKLQDDTSTLAKRTQPIPFWAQIDDKIQDNISNKDEVIKKLIEEERNGLYIKNRERRMKKYGLPFKNEACKYENQIQHLSPVRSQSKRTADLYYSDKVLI